MIMSSKYMTNKLTNKLYSTDISPVKFQQEIDGNVNIVLCHTTCFTVIDSMLHKI
jgi:hypothetical protein